MSRTRAPTGPTPTTPLRRISRGSLNALSHSASKQLSAGATPLSFLQGAMTDLAEEVGVLQLNMTNVEAVHESLHSFNENFAMYIYGLKMNAYCVEWPEAPRYENFDRAEKRIAQQAQQYAAQQNLDVASQTYMQQQQQQMYNPAADQTYVTTDDESMYRNEAPIAAPAKPALKSALKKSSNAATTATSAAGAAAKKAAPSAAAAGAAKPKMTLAQKKKREAYSDEIIETLPLEYRSGNEPKQNAIAKHVCMALLAAGGKGLRIADIVKTPEMSQAKINKTLIALVAAKHVVKESGGVYSLDSARHPTLP
ncbi:DASH complex subunit DAM1 [Pseudozyma hubeiensis]|nr:DASH complex subunit DAM1 [Pseudozyma hubeiensis]